jgi:hypothetical protein
MQSLGRQLPVIVQPRPTPVGVSTCCINATLVCSGSYVQLEPTMTDLPAESELVLEEATDNHWIGTARGMVAVFAYEGSHTDARHVHTAARLVERLRREQNGPVMILFVLPRNHSKPPDAFVRNELAKVMRRLDAHVKRAALVVLGTGFAAAIHRGAVAGILTVLRSRMPVKIAGTVEEGLAHLVDPQSAGFDALLRTCITLAESPPPRDSRRARV